MQLVTRAGWGARPFTQPNGAITYAGPRRGIKYHHLGESGNWQPKQHTECAAKVRAIQNHHMDRNGWSDIGYSFLVCPHGYVFEGRGLRRRNSANGSTSLNEQDYAVVLLISDSSKQKPGDAMLRGAAEAGDYIRKNGPCGNWVGGHSDGHPTACPGTNVLAWVRAGAKAPGGTKTHTVVKGENLTVISRKYGLSVNELYNANKKLIGPDPNKLSIGMVLTVPAKSSPKPPAAKPYVAPPFPAGLGPNKSRPPARQWQRVLKALGLMNKNVVESDNYGPLTQAGTIAFHNKYPQFRSIGVSRDPAVGPKGWKHGHEVAYGGKK